MEPELLVGLEWEQVWHNSTFDGIHAGEAFLPGFPYSNLSPMLHPSLHHFFTLFLFLFLSENMNGTWYLNATCKGKKILSWMWNFSHFPICNIFKICARQGWLEEPGGDSSTPLGGGPDRPQHKLGERRGRMPGSCPPETSIPGVTALPVDYIC